jgi:hypothetical protein
MADLASRATDGRISFIKYVTENPRFKEIDFEIEKGKTAEMYVKKGKAMVPGAKKLVAGTKIKITEAKMVEVGNLKLAKVKAGTVDGFIPINTIRKPTGGNGTQYEDQVVDAINAYIKKAGGMIDVRLKGSTKTYKNIRYAIKVETPLKQQAGVRGDPKADIIMCVDKKNPLGPGSIYISHKKEGGPEAFQQYGGLSEQAGVEINNHPLVQKFLGEVAKVIGTGSQLPNPVMATFKDDVLANMSIYGPEYGKAFSLQHTQLIGQGNPKFAEKSGYVEMEFSSHMSLSGDLSHFQGGYLPVFGATFRAGRGFDYKGKRYNGARVAIYPKKLMETRSGLLLLEIKK